MLAEFYIKLYIVASTFYVYFRLLFNNGIQQANIKPVCLNNPRYICMANNCELLNIISVDYLRPRHQKY